MKKKKVLSVFLALVLGVAGFSVVKSNTVAPNQVQLASGITGGGGWGGGCESTCGGG
jgi:hypothetical protein